MRYSVDLCAACSDGIHEKHMSEFTVIYTPAAKIHYICGCPICYLAPVRWLIGEIVKTKSEFMLRTLFKEVSILRREIYNARKLVR